MEDDYGQPKFKLDPAMQWALKRGLDFKTLAACCELVSQNPSDFLGHAVLQGRHDLAMELVQHMGVGDLYGLNPQHRLALLAAPSEAELADCVKRKASITKKARSTLSGGFTPCCGALGSVQLRDHAHPLCMREPHGPSQAFRNSLGYLRLARRSWR